MGRKYPPSQGPPGGPCVSCSQMHCFLLVEASEGVYDRWGHSMQPPGPASDLYSPRGHAETQEEQVKL